MSPPRPEPSAARPAWVGVLALYAALAVGGWWGVLPAALGTLALLKAAYSRRDGLLLLGPFAAWELVRAARRQRVHLWRGLLGAGLLLILLVGAWDLRGDGLNPRTAPRLAEAAFFGVGVGLFWLVGLYALSNLPAVIAEEREANRLDHLLVTDLRDRELLLGKLAGRLAVLAGYAAVPIPVLAMLTLFGGVDPLQVLALGVVVFAGLAGFAGVAVAASATCRKVPTAVLATVVACGAVLYLFELAERAAFPLAVMPKGVRDALSPDALRATSAVADGLQFVAGGSPIKAGQKLDRVARTGGLVAAVGPALRGLLAGQLLVLAAGWWWACRRLRMPAAVAAPRRGVRGLFSPAIRRPPVGDEPVYWYEVTSPQSLVDRLANRLYGGRWWVPAAVVGGFVGLVAATGAGLSPDEVQRRLQAIIPASGSVLFCVVTIPVGWAASRSPVRERERGTLDALLLSGLDPREIVYQKWRAAALAPRGRYATAAVLLFWGACGGGSIAGAIAVVVTTAANAALAASLGLFCSVTAKTGNKAFATLAAAGTGWAFGCGLLAGMCGSAGTAMLLAAVVPAAPQAAAGFLGLERGANAEIAFVVALGALASTGGAFLAYHAAADRFADQVRPKREADE